MSAFFNHIKVFMQEHNFSSTDSHDMLPNLAARLQESNNDTNLNVGTFSEIKARLFSF
jgi:hypothetical protein